MSKKYDTNPKNKTPEQSDPIVDFEEEKFFNEDSYNNFVKRVKIDMLSTNFLVNNDLHKEELIVPDDYRMTSEIMTLAEYTRVIEERAKQIENGSPIFITLKTESDPIKIAEKEIKQKKCPLKIARFLTKNIKEEWDVNEMILPFGAH